MKSEVYKKIAGKYVGVYKKFSNEPKSSSRFRDVAGNLVSSLEATASLICKGKDDKKFWEKDFRKRLKIVRSYFRLLEEFPEFKKAEFTSPSGYFPDLYTYVSSSKDALKEQEEIFGYSPCMAAHYVILANQKLYGAYR